jgi:hypothetical protein
LQQEVFESGELLTPAPQSMLQCLQCLQCLQSKILRLIIETP